MLFLPDLTSRNLVPEKMDDPDLPAADHELALRGLRRINRISGTVGYLASEILKIAKEHRQNHLNILDIGCANGENLIALQQHLSKHLSISAIGWDISPFAIKSGQEAAIRKGLTGSQVRFETVDALNLTESHPVADIVMNSLFMHHFDEDSVVQLLRQSARLARISVLADDLCRTKLGWLLAKIGCLALSRSPIVHFDGPQSVRAAFSPSEITALAKQAGLERVQILRHWPERFTLKWERASGCT